MRVIGFNVHKTVRSLSCCSILFVPLLMAVVTTPNRSIRGSTGGLWADVNCSILCGLGKHACINKPCSTVCVQLLVISASYAGIFSESQPPLSLLSCCESVCSR